MIRKPTSGDSDQREREAERARKHSQLSAAQSPQESNEDSKRGDASTHSTHDTPMHGAGKGESAHGAIPRRGIDSE